MYGDQTMSDCGGVRLPMVYSGRPLAVPQEEEVRGLVTGPPEAGRIRGGGCCKIVLWGGFNLEIQ